MQRLSLKREDGEAKMPMKLKDLPTLQIKKRDGDCLESGLKP